MLSVVAVVAVIACTAVVPGPFAAVIRSVFEQAKLSHLLVIAGVAGLLAVVGLVAPNVLSARRRVKTATRLLARARGGLGSIVDRTPWVAAVALVAAVAAAGWYSLGRGLVLPRIFADELIHVENARGLLQDGALARKGYGLATPAVNSIAYLFTDNDVNAYRLIQALNVAVMVTAALPAYLLARRALSHRWALVAAALTVTVPWMTYSRFVMTEALFYPVLMTFSLALVRALERPTLARQLVLLLALVPAYATRAQAIVLPCAVVCAVLFYGLARNRILAVLRAFAATWTMYAVAGVGTAALAATGLWKPLGAYGVLLGSSWQHPRGLALWAASNVTSLSLGLGVLVVLACPLGAAAMLRRRDNKGEQALACVAASLPVWWLLPVAVLSVSPYGLGTVHERSLFFIAPLVFICAIAWATHGFARPPLLTGATVAAVVGMAVAMPSGVITGSVDALSFKLWTQLESGSFSASSQMIMAVVVGAAVLVRMRTAWPLVFTVALAAIGVAAASDYRSDEPRSLVSRYAWVDRTLAREASATILWVGGFDDGCPGNKPHSELEKMALYTEFFNSQIEQVGHVRGDNQSRGLASDRFAIRPDGVVTSKGVPLHPDFVVSQTQIGIVGSRVALLPAGDVATGDEFEGNALALWRVTPPLRLAHPSEVIDSGRSCEHD